MNLYGLFILDVNIKYIILYRHINVPMACKELKIRWISLGFVACFDLIISISYYTINPSYGLLDT